MNCSEGCGAYAHEGGGSTAEATGPNPVPSEAAGACGRDGPGDGPPEASPSDIDFDRLWNTLHAVVPITVQKEADPGVWDARRAFNAAAGIWR